MNFPGKTPVLAALVLLSSCADFKNKTASKVVHLSETSSSGHSVRQIVSVLEGEENIATRFTKVQKLEIYLGNLESLDADSLTKDEKQDILNALGGICEYIDAIKDDLGQQQVIDFIERVGILSSKINV